MIIDLTILELLPFYKKEKINFRSERESNKISYKKCLADLKERKKDTLSKVKDKSERKEAKAFFGKAVSNLKRKKKELKLTAKINYMSAVSRNKELKENVKLIKKSKSNLHRVLYEFAKLPYEEKKNSLVVQELSPSREAKFSIKRRVFEDLSAYSDKKDDRVYASEKDIMFTTIQFGTGTEKIPIVLRYSGQCVPVFLDKVRDDTYDKFSTENEHHIMLYSAKIRETKAPKNKIKINKMTFMIILMTICGIGYMVYKYTNGGL